MCVFFLLGQYGNVRCHYLHVSLHAHGQHGYVKYAGEGLSNDIQIQVIAEKIMNRKA